MLHEDSFDVSGVKKKGDAVIFTFPISADRFVDNGCSVCDGEKQQVCVVTFRYRPFLEVRMTIWNHGSLTDYPQKYYNETILETESTDSLVKISETNLILQHKKELSCKQLLVRVFFSNTIYSIRQIASIHWQNFRFFIKKSMTNFWYCRAKK